jgi:hypothetical protein
MQAAFVSKFWSKVEVSPGSKKRHLIHSVEQNPSWEAGSSSDGEEISPPPTQICKYSYTPLQELVLELLNPFGIPVVLLLQDAVYIIHLYPSVTDHSDIRLKCCIRFSSASFMLHTQPTYRTLLGLKAIVFGKECKA